MLSTSAEVALALMPASYATFALAYNKSASSVDHLSASRITELGRP